MPLSYTGISPPINNPSQTHGAPMSIITVKNLQIATHLPLTVICGPCAIENESHAFESAHQLKEIFAAANIPFIYKSSFDKANRSSMSSARGIGMEKGLAILHRIRTELNIPVVTDVHETGQAALAAPFVDMLQTPAFLCRQTDFITDVASAGLPVNIKKGQFLSPWDMHNVIAKALATGNTNILACERGTSFGYGNLVVDMRSLQIMSSRGTPVVFDATHSVQLPGANGNSSGGQREFVPTLARAAVATGIAALFLESHQNPDEAPCDGPNMVPFHQLPQLLAQLKEIDTLVKTPTQYPLL